MRYTTLKKLPSVEEIVQAIPLSSTAHQKILQDRQEVNHILEGKDKRLLIIVGPCSAWPNTAVLEYAKRLQQLNEKVKHALKLVMRVYIQKPRTTKGWAGPFNQSNPFLDPDIEMGMRYTRDMMVHVVEMGLAIADEALFTHNARGFLDLLSWVAIGARSAEDQEHRVFASLIPCAVGMKNPTHGSLSIAVNSVIVAQQAHVTVLDNHEVKTQGNVHAHVVLRGNNNAPNYTNEHLLEIKKYMDVNHVVNPSIIIDVSHDNCVINGKKDPTQQPNIIFNVLNNINNQPELKNIVKGFMIESFLKEGCQKIDVTHPENLDLNGLSITDPCLGWRDTEKTLLDLASTVNGA